jgi:hypothetical protein
MVCVHCGKPIHPHLYFDFWIHDGAWKLCPDKLTKAEPKT